MVFKQMVASCLPAPGKKRPKALWLTADDASVSWMAVNIVPEIKDNKFRSNFIRQKNSRNKENYRFLRMWQKMGLVVSLTTGRNNS
jgi:hypothetical protein